MLRVGLEHARNALLRPEELSNAASRFGTRKECVAAALKYYGKDRATVKETKELVSKFMSKEVK